MPITRRVWLTTAAAAGIGFLNDGLRAAPPRSTLKTARATADEASATKGLDTEVVLELITDATSAAEHAQAWGQRLQKIGVSFQTRQAVTGDKLTVKEQKLGRLRRVTVVAQLDRNGKIICQDRTFSLDQAEKLGEWIRELKAYGAQGAPHGKPMFGLDRTQFTAVLKELSAIVELDTQGLTLSAALEKLPLPNKLPVVMTTEAQRAVHMLDADQTLRQNTQGLSVGTAFATVLGEFGLAFKPLRTPEGSIELSVFPREADSDFWPLGWPLDASKPQGQIAPALFKMVPVELEDVPLTDVLTAASKSSDVPIVIDYFATDREGIEWSELKVNVPARKTTWGLLLKQVTFPHKLGRRIVTDETGRPVVLITTLKESLKEPAAK